MSQPRPTFQELVQANPDLYDEMDCRPGPPSVSQEYIDSFELGSGPVTAEQGKATLPTDDKTDK